MPRLRTGFSSLAVARESVVRWESDSRPILWVPELLAGLQMGRSRPGDVMPLPKGDPRAGSLHVQDAGDVVLVRVVHRDRRSQRCGACRGQQRQGHDDEGKPSHDFSSGSAQTTVAGAFNAPLARDLHARRVAPRYARPAVRLSRQEESNGLHLQARVRGRTDGRSGDAQPSCADVVGWRHHPLGRRPTRVVGIRMRCIIAPSALTVPFKGRWHVCARPFCRGSRPKQLGGSGSKGLPAAPPGW